ncbi:MAG TPA: nuclear transport factor 2 family protein [Rhizomicrobium sp.]|nr:nuclear transport factor 2 family protein [Rhizomicrobium sp.]
MDDIAALAKRFFDGLEQGNIAILREVYAPNVKIWHNTDGLEQTLEDNEATLTGFIERIPKRQYANRRVHTFPGGFVQQHTLKGTRKDGKEVALDAVIICKVENGKVTRLDEYFDSAAVARLRQP